MSDASAAITSESPPTSAACIRIAVSRTGFRSTATTIVDGQRRLIASPSDPPMNPKPTMATVGKMGTSEMIGRLRAIGSEERSASPPAPRDGLEADAAADRRSDDPQLRHQAIELRRVQRLRAVALGAIRVAMHLDEQAVGAGGDGGARHRRDLIAAAGAVAR